MTSCPNCGQFMHSAWSQLRQCNILICDTCNSRFVLQSTWFGKVRMVCVHDGKEGRQ